MTEFITPITDRTDFSLHATYLDHNDTANFDPTSAAVDAAVAGLDDSYNYSSHLFLDGSFIGLDNQPEYPHQDLYTAPQNLSSLINNSYPALPNADFDMTFHTSTTPSTDDSISPQASTASSLHPIPEDLPVPPKRRRSQPQPPQSDLVQDTQGKRGKFLERNRVAASKCRQKKKVWMSGLEEATIELETKHSTLQKEAKDLASEIRKMKNQLMTHASCRDVNIDTWIDTEARKFVSSHAGQKLSDELHAVDCVSSPIKSSPAVSVHTPQFDAAFYNHMSDDAFDPDLV